MRFSTSCAVVLATAVVATPTPPAPQGIFQALPSNAIDGAYRGTLKADGSTQWEYLGDADLVSEPSQLPRGFSNLVRRGRQGHGDENSGSETSYLSEPEGGASTDTSEASTPIKRWQGQAAAGAFCTRREINADDVDRAIERFGDLCGTGHTFTSVLAVQSGSAISYGCFYGNGETTCYNNANSGPGLIRRAVDYCGRGRSAWYSLPSGQVSYGVNNFNQPFC
ncbi:hypothetical protein NLG97_g1877 [Lecanicillium saksenae]|uniref:Uncharacterized protein n=1 Tax=Lecanicillium saksenae TaxID=468837 RepID=A0ACC1R3X1_9HYPO|nr:hypothetical protein NLG97_g1877 [Lecanicillium saksenae]